MTDTAIHLGANRAPLWASIGARVARRLPAHPELDEHRGRAVDAVCLVGGPPDGRPVPVRAHDPRRHRPDHGQPGLVRVD